MGANTIKHTTFDRVDRNGRGSHAGRVFATQRQERILEQVRLMGSVRVADLVQQLDVSDMTIRRDIAGLAERGLVLRVHGGATAVATRPSGPAAAGGDTWHQGSPERAAISLLAASCVTPGSTVALAGGSMAPEVAMALREVAGLTVVTNSLPAADILHAGGRDDLTVVLTGGERAAGGSLVGPLAVAALGDLHVDWAILGPRGMDEQAGMTVPTLPESETDRAIMASGARVVFAVESSRWQTVSLCTIATLAEVDILVTDSGLRPAARRVLDAAVGELMVSRA
jgi:DeoR/GlpR family transcriptional regulator of sugar metabolism